MKIGLGLITLRVLLNISVLVVFTLVLSACSDKGMSKTGEGALVGGAVGAGAGAIIGNQVDGRSGEGAAIGAVAGAATGAVVGHAEERNFEETIAEQQEIIRRQEEEIRRQDRELEDLRRQQFHNESLRRFEAR